MAFVVKCVSVMLVFVLLAFSGKTATAGSYSGVNSKPAEHFGAISSQQRRNPVQYPGFDVQNRLSLDYQSDSTAHLRFWNDVALDANALDHTPAARNEIRVFGEQIGPHRTSRALAIVHIAIYDAVNAIAGRPGYTGLLPAASDTSKDAAIAQAAHDTLAALYPSQRRIFDQRLAEDLARIRAGRARLNGIDLGRRAAEAILALRSNDGSARPEPIVGIDFFPSNLPGKWRPDPVSDVQVALGAFWGRVRPFVIDSAQQFGLPPPPALTSAEYASAFAEVRRLGGDGIVTPTQRNRDQTIAGIYWGYDGTPGLGTPPRLYNQIALKIAELRSTGVDDLARLLALVNVAIADSAIAGWETKYEYQFWRPVTAVREASPGTGPTGRGDGNPNTIGDPGFTPLGAPATNLRGPNFTPPFPSYASGHAIFGGALFQILRRFYGTDRIAFTFVSDEFNGINRDNTGRIRPRIPRSFASLSQAEEENGQSRIYLGIHWRFDKDDGIAQGRRVADAVFGEGLVAPAFGGRNTILERPRTGVRGY